MCVLFVIFPAFLLYPAIFNHDRPSTNEQGSHHQEVQATLPGDVKIHTCGFKILLQSHILNCVFQDLVARSYILKCVFKMWLQRHIYSHVLCCCIQTVAVLSEKTALLTKKVDPAIDKTLDFVYNGISVRPNKVNFCICDASSQHLYALLTSTCLMHQQPPQL